MKLINSRLLKQVTENSTKFMLPQIVEAHENETLIPIAFSFKSTKFIRFLYEIHIKTRQPYILCLWVPDPNYDPNTSTEKIHKSYFVI